MVARVRIKSSSFVAHRAPGDGADEMPLLSRTLKEASHRTHSATGRFPYEDTQHRALVLRLFRSCISSLQPESGAGPLRSAEWIQVPRCACLRAPSLAAARNSHLSCFLGQHAGSVGGLGVLAGEGCERGRWALCCHCCAPVSMTTGQARWECNAAQPGRPPQAEDLLLGGRLPVDLRPSLSMRYDHNGGCPNLHAQVRRGGRPTDHTWIRVGTSEQTARLTITLINKLGANPMPDEHKRLRRTPICMPETVLPKLQYRRALYERRLGGGPKANGPCLRTASMDEGKGKRGGGGPETAGRRRHMPLSPTRPRSNGLRLHAQARWHWPASRASARTSCAFFLRKGVKKGDTGGRRILRWPRISSANTTGRDPPDPTHATETR